MAKLSWTIEAASGTVTEDSPTLSDANMDRFLDWIWYAYPQMDEADPPAPLPRNPANEAQAFRDWANAQWQGTKANVLRWEKTEAAQSASDGVPDIE